MYKHANEQDNGVVVWCVESYTMESLESLLLDILKEYKYKISEKGEGYIYFSYNGEKDAKNKLVLTNKREISRAVQESGDCVSMIGF